MSTMMGFQAAGPSVPEQGKGKRKRKGKRERKKEKIEREKSKQNPEPEPEPEPEEFKPRPGDVILRKTPHILTAHDFDVFNPRNEILSVMGILHIYGDDYYFMYADGEQRIMRFTFWNGDRILRHMEFTTSMYTWKPLQTATLHLYHHTIPGAPGVWHMVAQSESNPTEKNNMTSYYHHNLVLNRHFLLAAGDFIIRETAAVAPDRPWGTSYELKVVRQEDERTMNIVPRTSSLMGGSGDVVLRIRMTNPTPVELHAALFELPIDMRSLGLAHRIFRDLSLDAPSTALQKYSKCPLLPGCLIINLEESLDQYYPEFLGRSTGHIMFYRSDENWEHPPQDLPGSMVLQFGCFMSRESRATTQLVISTTAWSPLNLQNPGNPYACWCTVAPKLIIHDEMTRDGWIDANLYRISEVEPEEPEEAMRGDWPEPEDLEHYAEVIEALQEERGNDPSLNLPEDPPLVPGADDIILNKGIITQDHLAMFSLQQRGIFNQGGRTFVELPGAFGQPLLLPIRQPNRTVYQCFWWDPHYEPQDGDFLIRLNPIDESPLFEGKWFFTVELYGYHKPPRRYDLRQEGVWALRGMDKAIFPPEAAPGDDFVVDE
ncbi:hypothetical protein AXG93_939s1150 [Marchantia polymorpha subsp. ruderalis]|uniref:Uncharacterized protein n=1 Tax=Marchantia polymorpha subsp. ruderalis TaxID=1480154 RepID=A0A176VKX0_MARPO|nr:hypothetical protein AXG93_939s1150 [Marchantia polymorpha subsp. ruderalis]